MREIGRHMTDGDEFVDWSPDGYDDLVTVEPKAPVARRSASRPSRTEAGTRRRFWPTSKMADVNLSRLGTIGRRMLCFEEGCE
jgi:hypothetical protein